MHDDEDWVDTYDWYGDLPWWSRWWKHGGWPDFKYNLKRAIKHRSLYEFRAYRKFHYKLKHRRDNAT